MVLKVGKSGVCSGNTFRLAKSRYLNRYASESFISFSESGVSQNDKSDIRKAKFLDSSDVCYSLNKKGRWRLPSVIKEEIATSLTDINCKVSLLELHKHVRISNCVGYYTNKGAIKRVLPNKSTYLNRLSVTQINAKPRKRKTRQRRLRGGNHEDDEANETPQIELPVELTYNVIYPCSVDNPITLSNPNWIDCHQRIAPSFKNKGKRRRMTNELCTREESYYSDDKSVCEADENIPCELDDYLFKRSSSDLSDYFQNALLGNKGYKKRSRRPRGISAKKPKEIPIKHHIRYLDEDPSEYLDEDASPVYAQYKSTESAPTQVILPKSEVDNEYLQQRFPQSITYAQCQPRKFIIDISKNVSEHLKQSELFKHTFIQKLELTSFLVFKLKDSIDNTNDLYEVNLNFHTKLPCIGIETIYDGMITTLDDVLQRTLLFIATVPPESYYQKDFLEITRVPTVHFDTIGPIQHLEATSVRPEILANSLISTNNSDYMEFEWITVETEKHFCNICFEDVSSDVSSTALNECAHWFCDNCWREHLLSIFNSGLAKISCPEYDCDKTIDIPTMVTLVNIRDIQRFQARDISTSVNCSTTRKWCPNKLCGRILQRLGSHDGVGSVVLCKCGTVVCFKCIKEGHWPATCYEFSVYKNKLNSFGDDILQDGYSDIPTIVVRGKRCPVCNTFIEKHGGCPSMLCVCGTNFCWTCVTPWKDHKSVNCFQKKDIDGTESVTVRHITKKVTGNPVRSNLYSKAVENRRLRNRKHIKLVKHKADLLKIHVKNWIKKCRDTTVNTNLISSMDYVDTIFKDIVNINIELNYVAEYCFVVVDCNNHNLNPCLQNIKYAAHSLQRLSSNIFQLITNDNYKHLQRTLSNIISRKERAISSIHSAVNLINRYRKSQHKM